MRELKTKTQVFNCGFCVYHAPKKQYFIRLDQTDKMRAIMTFDDPAELAELSYDGQQIPSKSLVLFRNEGELAFFILEAE